MSELLALGISHKTAPVAVRERLALPPGRMEEFLRQLVSDGDVLEAAGISTCNRTELYLVAADPVEAETAALGMLARHAGIRPTELTGSIYSLRNCDVARHLYRVTSGLESMIVGEAEVQGQVKRAYEHAREAGVTGPMLNRLFRAALATGKRARTETAISESKVSISSVAVDIARDAIGPLQEREVVILGAGETSELTAQALAGEGVRTVFVANRHRERAISFAARYGGTAVPLDDLPTQLERVDILVASTASPHPILGAEELGVVMEARGGRPLLLIDIAVPRDVEPECASLPGVTLCDMDDLQETVARNRGARKAEAIKAEAIIESELERFAEWLGSLETLPTISALRERGQEIVAGVLAENSGRWESLSERDRERLDTLARTIVSRLLHEPTVRLRDLRGDRVHARIHVLRELFALDGEDAPVELEEPRVAGAEVRELRSQSRPGA